MSKFLTPAQQELLAVMSEADQISQRSEISNRDNSRLSYLLAKMKALQSSVITTGTRSTENVSFFRDLLTNKEMRAADMQAGAQTIAWTQGAEGGFLVPQEFHSEVILGMAQFDPLLDSNVVTLIPSPDFSLRPYTIPGWDLSTFAAQQVSEGSQQTGQTPPTVSGKILNSYKYKASLPLSIELEEDAFESIMSLMGNAYSIAFARGIGAALATGNGTTAPQGVLTGCGASVYTTANSGKLVEADFNAVYFKVDRFHRNAPKCAWLMNDVAYQQARNATDSVGNPLLKLIHDKETIMGKPVLVSPSLPAYNASLGSQQAGSFCVFGDLSHMFVRVSKMVVKRQWQLPGYVDNGLALYTGLMRADAKLFDPTSGGAPPIVCATMHA